MNTNEAITVLAKNYGVPEKVLVGLIVTAKGELGTAVSDLALSSWLKEQAQKYERGMGNYGQKVRIESLSEVALYRMAAERLEKRSLEAATFSHACWLACREPGTLTWSITLPDANPSHSLEQALEIEIQKPIAMA